MSEIINNLIVLNFWKFTYLLVAYGFRERPFKWAVVPEPLWLNKLCEFLYAKWMYAANGE